MNHCGFKNAFAACEEMRSSVSISDRKDPVACPKPRRLGLLNHAINEPLTLRSLRCDSKAGMELLDIILAKGNYGGGEQSTAQLGSSPPFFCGSPPSRAANPLIQDARFGNEKLIPVSPLSSSGSNPVSSANLSSSPSSSSSRKGGICVRTKFGHKPAAVRIEGFDCRDRRNCSIPAVA